MAMMNRTESKHQQFYVESSRNEQIEEIYIEDEEYNNSAFNNIMLLQQLLQENMNYKRENDLNKLRHLESDTIAKCNYDWQLMKLHKVYVKSPRILHPAQNNRYVSDIYV